MYKKMNISYLDVFGSKYSILFKKRSPLWAIACLIYFTPQVLDAQEKSIILEELKQQEEYWNGGDINRFMDTYYKSDSISFTSSNGVNYGWTNILERYKKAYPTKKEMGRLEFELIELRPLSDTHYLCLGKYTLRYPESTSNGFFSLLWQKIDEKWKIISDHTSASVKNN